VKRTAVVALTTAIAACHGSSTPRPASSVLPGWGPPQPGDRAPELVLPSLRGGSVRLSSLRGHWVLLHFTASWCPFCDAEVSHLGDIADAHTKDGLVVLLVDEREPLDHWASYAREKVAPSIQPLSDATGESALPFVPPGAHPEFGDRGDAIFDSTLLIDPDGVIRLFLMPDSAHFDPTFPDVRRELARTFGGVPVAATEPPRARTDGPLDASRVVSVALRPQTIAPGAHGEIAVSIRIAPGYHTMSDRPSKPEYIPTRITVGEAGGLTFGAVTWPPATSFDLGAETIATFEHEVIGRVPVDAAADAARGTRTVRGTLHYQACTRASCLAPATTPFETTIDVQ
jgi:peroxiredoxin